MVKRSGGWTEDTSCELKQPSIVHTGEYEVASGGQVTGGSKNKGGAKTLGQAERMAEEGSEFGRRTWIYNPEGKIIERWQDGIRLKHVRQDRWVQD